jgi:hypothetical protein
VVGLTFDQRSVPLNPASVLLLLLSLLLLLLLCRFWVAASTS